MISAPEIEWRKNAAAIDSIAIGLSVRQPTCVEIVSHFFALDDANGGRQQSVQCALKFVCWQV